ncbi:MAG: hypothetical protein SGI92_05910 [Bryobacteraceae bacterium]|nr:hypothetical protein [Bryobacteraceae bacterium]
MIDIKQVTDAYRVGREKPGGKVYVMDPHDANVAAYSGFTRTLEWYQAVSPEDAAMLKAYLDANY